MTVSLIPKREIIGPADCPIMHRWTLLHRHRFLPCKVMLHHFLPFGDDRDPHDHPMNFITVVLKGRYVDHSLGMKLPGGGHAALEDELKAPAIRYRSAEHTHITRAGKEGAWTLVITGSVVRGWGFLRDGKWWPWKDYEKEFGFAMRCEDLDDRGNDLSVKR